MTGEVPLHRRTSAPDQPVVELQAAGGDDSAQGHCVGVVSRLTVSPAGSEPMPATANAEFMPTRGNARARSRAPLRSNPDRGLRALAHIAASPSGASEDGKYAILLKVELMGPHSTRISLARI